MKGLNLKNGVTVIKNRNYRYILKIFALLTIFLFILNLFSSINAFYSGKTQVNNLQKEYYIKILRVKASDNVELKSLVCVNKSLMDEEDRSVPLVVVCHGMNGDFWSSKDLIFTFAKAGFMVIAPEFRGHKSNRAPSTLGLKEPGDIIDILDYAEKEFKFVDTNKSAIFGISMGGLYATSAYILESKEMGGKGRFKALVDAGGPVNISRAVDYYLNNRDMFGDVALLENISQKNPIKYVNATFPTNVMLWQGDDDKVVPFNCSLDFYHALDPDGTRNGTDIVFYELHGLGHGQEGFNEYRYGVAWIEHILFNSNISVGSIQKPNIDFKIEYGYTFQKELFNSALVFIFLVMEFYYLIYSNPKYEKDLETTQRGKKVATVGTLSNRTINENQENDKRSPRYHKSRTRILKAVQKAYSSKYLRLKILIFYFILQFIAGIIARLFIHEYILTELFVPAIFSLLYIVFIKWAYLKANNDFSVSNPYNLNKYYPKLKINVIWTACILISLYFVLIFTNLNYVEDAILVAGVRLGWWTPFFATTLTISALSNWYLIMFLFNLGKLKTKETLNKKENYKNKKEIDKTNKKNNKGNKY
ncbi:MAG: alpha/beta hydrolase family protein, partial [Promethearchaeota archaeon]